MARPVDPEDLIPLPRLDANAACVLASSLEAAALDEKGKPRKLPESAKVALQDLTEDRKALQDALGTPPARAPVVREADLLEDNAVGAFVDLLKAWARLAGKIPQGDVAAQLQQRLFKDGLGFLNLTAREEWGMVEGKLQIIAREKLAPQVEQLGAAPMLAYLRDVHKEYGKVTGATQATPAPESPEVRAKYDALLGSIRHYAGAVVGSIIRRRPETRERAEALLRPLSEWKTPRPKGKGKGEGPGQGGGGEGGPVGQ